MKTLITIALLLTLLNAARAQNPPLPGKALFQNNCTTCHGDDGTKGRWGAADLRASRLNDEALFNTITTGRGFMPKWGRKFTAAQIQTIIAYLKTLRK